MVPLAKADPVIIAVKNSLAGPVRPGISQITPRWAARPVSRPLHPPVLAAAPLGPRPWQRSWDSPALCKAGGRQGCMPASRLARELVGPLPPGSPEARTPQGPPGTSGAADWAKGGNRAGCQLQASPRPPPHPLIVFILQIFHLHLGRTVRATGGQGGVRHMPLPAPSQGGPRAPPSQGSLSLLSPVPFPGGGRSYP